MAEILRPRGNQGEVVVKSLTDVPGRLEGLRHAQAKLADGADVPVEITKAWVHDGDWVLKFRGVDSIGEAERFRRADLWVPAEERGQLPPGEYFVSDLIGCVLVDAATGAELGIVAGWQACGGPPLMEVAVKGRVALVPFAPAICREVDVAGRRIRVELPEGLLDL